LDKIIRFHDRNVVLSEPAVEICQLKKLKPSREAKDDLALPNEIQRAAASEEPNQRDMMVTARDQEA
jgi:hypothetical protein